MKTKILMALKNADGYLSGQELCERFSVSRTAVWKVINQLKEEGYEVEAVRNRGYRLLSVSDVLSAEELKSRFDGHWFGKEVFYYDAIDSTNTQALRLAEEGAPHGSLVVAGTQTRGKGRRGRAWTSEPGSGAWMTILLRPDFPPAGASMLTLIMGMAVAAAAEELSGVHTQIKWPNDVVMNGKKICGILTELSAEPDYIHHVIIGAGTNVNTASFPEELTGRASSLYLESGRRFRLADVIERIGFLFEGYYGKFIVDGDLSGLVEEYNARLAGLGDKVRVLDPKGAFEGIARGINGKGELLVELADKSIANVYAGEVSVRGLNGYI